MKSFYSHSTEYSHGGAFSGRFVGIAFEPAHRFDFAGEAAPEGTFVIESAVADGAEGVIFGSFGWFGQFQKCDKGFLKNIFRFAVGEAKGAAVQEELGGLF